MKKSNLITTICITLMVALWYVARFDLWVCNKIISILSNYIQLVLRHDTGMIIMGLLIAGAVFFLFWLIILNRKGDQLNHTLTEMLSKTQKEENLKRNS